MDDQTRHENFCRGIDRNKCGCLQTAGVKLSALHVKHIIEVCETLPLQHAEIRTFLHTIGLEVWRSKSTQDWSFHGDLYRFYGEYIQRTDDIFPAFNLCMKFWSYTNSDVTHNLVDTQLNIKYKEYDTQFKTIKSEIFLFIGTYPLQRHGVAPEPNPQTNLTIRHLLQQLNF